MLELIANYAVQKGLTVVPGFSPKRVKWLIRLNRDGEFIGVEALGSGDKSDPGLEIRNCPEFPANEMQSGGKAHPLVESLNVVALHSKAPDEEPPAKDRAKHLFFVELLREYGSVKPEAALAAAALGSPEILRRIGGELHRAKAKATDKATIAVDDGYLVEDPRMPAWWQSRLSPTGNEEPEASSVCLVTGEPTRPLATHPKIGGLGSVGGLGIGSSLISFDKGAFASYGLDQSANAAVSVESAMRYRAGLNHLIANGKKLGPMIVAYWYSGTVPDVDDPLPFLLEGDAVSESAEALIRVGKLLSALRTGDRPDLARNRFYALSVSGAAGRVMLRGWEEGTFASLVEAVYAWFQDLAITTSDGAGTIRNPKFIAVAASTVRDLDELQGPALAALWKSASGRCAIPLAAVMGALNRTRIDILDDQTRSVRMALLKAYIVRNTTHGDHMKPCLNPDHPNVAYQAGRLMAVLADIQYAALGNVNANIIQRFYPAASSTPALVFGRLTRQSQFHLNKIGGGRARVLDRKLADIWGRVCTDLPTTFTLEQQTLFALGYYQQQAQDAFERNPANKASTPAPEAEAEAEFEDDTEQS